MIYDCFIFWNEFDLLEIRLNELKDVVDQFVICESDVTFVGKPKPLFLRERIDEFKDFNINLLTFEGKRNPETSWTNEIAQRNYLATALQGAFPKDTVILSDVDEIPTVNTVSVLPYCDGIVSLQMTFSYYFVNNLHKNVKWYHPKAFKVEDLSQSMHDLRHSGIQDTIEMAGHHMSYLGSLETIKNKISNFSHQEFNNLEFFNSMGDLYNANKSFFDSNLDLGPKDPFKIKTMPKYLLKNIQKFEKHFLPWKVNI